jgi:ribose transport system ATP-binding protein
MTADFAAIRSTHPGGVAAGMHDDPIVVAHGLSKHFEATRALQGVSLSFFPGQIHCLLGENGAGKSTLGKILGGIYEPDAGEILIAGEPVALRGVAEARALGIAVVFQELSLAPDLSVVENICLGTERRRHPLSLLHPRAERARCEKLLDELGLSVDPDARLRDLPTPHQQLVEIAKALSLRPRLLILDEPTAMLGAIEKQKLFAILRRLRQDGTAFIFITHHIEEVVEIGDHVSIMKDGMLIESFPMTPSIDPAFVVEKLAGQRVMRNDAKGRRCQGEELLRIRNLPARRGGLVDIEVRRGEVIGLYGVVGCGREDIAQSVVGLSASRFSLAFNGKDFRPGNPDAAARRGIGYLPVGRARNCILPTRSIRENLLLTQLKAFQRGGLLRESAEKPVAETQLRRLGVRYGKQEDPITSLSGGNQQKVLFGRCLGNAHNLMILEDPTAGIDIAAKAEIHELIRKRVEEGVAAILISSDLGETISICDKVYTLFKGQVVNEYVGPSLEDQPSIIADVLGSADDTSMPPSVTERPGPERHVLGG